MAEEFAFHKRVRNSAAVDHHKGSIFALGVIVDGPGNQFLTCPAFSADEHIGFCRADLAYPLVNGLHARAVPNDAVEMQMTFKFS